MALFRGFSTIDAVTSRNWSLHGIDLIERDLMNAFMCRVGERVMRPADGCKIWNIFMDGDTETNREAIVAEVIRICSLDSRVAILGVDINFEPQSVTVSMSLNYVPYNTVQNFYVSFTARQDSLYGGTTQNN